MRNGPPSASDEDRGNAILSNLPLTDLVAIELPFERQRRVAIAATIAGRTTAGAPWRLRVVSAHLDNIGGAKRAYLAAEYGRTRQARGLLTVLAGSEPTILAGDFNTWFGFLDRAYIEMARAISTDPHGRSAPHISRTAAPRSRVLPARARVAGGVPACGRTLRFRPLSDGGHRPVPLI